MWLMLSIRENSCRRFRLKNINFSALFEEDLLEALQPENCVAARTSYGGPAFSENAKQFSRGDVLLAEQQVVLDDLKARI